jgi:hypothetical protein
MNPTSASNYIRSRLLKHPMMIALFLIPTLL